VDSFAVVVLHAHLCILYSCIVIRHRYVSSILILMRQAKIKKRKNKRNVKIPRRLNKETRCFPSHLRLFYLFEAEVAHVGDTPSGVQQGIALDDCGGAVLQGDGHAVRSPRPFRAGMLASFCSFITSVSVWRRRVLDVVDFDAAKKGKKASNNSK